MSKSWLDPPIGETWGVLTHRPSIERTNFRNEARTTFWTSNSPEPCFFWTTSTFVIVFKVGQEFEDRSLEITPKYETNRMRKGTHTLIQKYCYISSHLFDTVDKHNFVNYFGLDLSWLCNGKNLIWFHIFYLTKEMTKNHIGNPISIFLNIRKYNKL